MTPREPAASSARAGSAEIDSFLAALPADLGDTLEALRATIRVAAPDAVETIAYSVPAFRYKGRPLVSLAPDGTGRVPAPSTSRVRS